MEREKLLGECQEEFFETFGQYEDEFVWDDKDDEDFRDWADRIRQEYFTKQWAKLGGGDETGEEEAL